MKGEINRKMAKEFTEEEKSGLYKAIHSRRDVRSHFTPRLIEDEILSKKLLKTKTLKSTIKAVEERFKKYKAK